MSESQVTPSKVQVRLPQTAFAFKGYDESNLGRSRELLAHPRFGPIVEPYLREASQVCANITGVPCDLPARVREGRETTVDSYADPSGCFRCCRVARLCCGYSSKIGC